MNCYRCHHSNETHRASDTSSSIMGLGACQIPDCTCSQYVDSIRKIDEDML